MTTTTITGALTTQKALAWNSRSSTLLLAAAASLVVLMAALLPSQATAASRGRMWPSTITNPSTRSSRANGSLASAAPSVQIHLVNSGGLPMLQVQAFQRAAVAQSKQLRQDWGTPIVRFGNRGWTMTVLPQHDARLHGTGGFHSYSNQPYALVAARSYWTVIASHELAEMLCDPHAYAVLDGYLLEVADPVRLLAYRLRGVEMSDFVTQAWFSRPAVGPYDFLHRLKHAGSIRFGHATTVNPTTGREHSIEGFWMMHGREAPFE